MVYCSALFFQKKTKFLYSVFFNFHIFTFYFLYFYLFFFFFFWSACMVRDKSRIGYFGCTLEKGCSSDKGKRDGLNCGRISWPRDRPNEWIQSWLTNSHNWIRKAILNIRAIRATCRLWQERKIEPSSTGVPLYHCSRHFFFRFSVFQ